MAVRSELAELIAREIKDPRVSAAGLVTVTSVELSDDLSNAKVGISLTGTDEGKAANLFHALSSAAGFLRGEVGRRLGLKRAPGLKFIWDRSVEQAQRIHALANGEGGEE